MTRRLAVAALSLATLVCSGCLGSVALHKAVLGYDHTVSRIEYEILLVNIGRLRHGLPVHFTVTSSIAAMFDYYYSVADTPWDRQAFTLLYQLFQMIVTEVSGVGVPITISK
jgi:hypothetical protein